eukprot:jgi/Bigna1/82754/fgenesh1_pg.96_\
MAPINLKRDVPLLAFNFSSAIILISCNKFVFKAGFSFPAILSLFQYCATYSLLEVVARFGIFTPLKAGTMDRQLTILAIVIGLATPISNLSLKYNSVGNNDDDDDDDILEQVLAVNSDSDMSINVGVYTIAKLLITPAAVAGDYMMRGKQISMVRGAILLFLCSSVLFTGKTDLELNFAGTLIIIAWLPVAVMYKVGWAKAVKERGFETLALMHLITPYAAMVIAVFALAVEPIDQFLEFEWMTMGGIVLVLLSGVAAFLINLSGFLVMGLLSPLTHIILGQAKSAVMMMIGTIFFAYNPPTKSLVGAFFAMLSITAYTYVNVKEQAASKATDPPIVQKANKIDIMLPVSIGDSSGSSSTASIKMEPMGGGNSIKQPAGNNNNNFKQADV